MIPYFLASTIIRKVRRGERNRWIKSRKQIKKCNIQEMTKVILSEIIRSTLIINVNKLDVPLF